MSALIMPDRGRGHKGFRAHLFEPRLWGEVPATDYWLIGDTGGQLGTLLPLSDFGYTTTSLVHTVGSAGDLLSPADVGTPGGLGTNAASDLFKSPAIFGDHIHAKLAEYFLGAYPRYLCLEMYISFTTASNNETGTAIGFVEDGGSPITAADHQAMVYSDGTNFGLRSGADSDAGIAVQTTPFAVRIRMAPGTTDKVQWWARASLAVSGAFVSQGTIDQQQDEAPFIFGFGQAAGGSNVVVLHAAHIFYSLDGHFEGK